MATKQQIPVLAGAIVSKQSAFEPLPDKDAQWAIENPEAAIALAVTAIINRNSHQAATGTIDWFDVYKKLGLLEEFEATALDLSVKPDLWSVPVVKGVTANKVVKALRDLGVKFYLYIDDLDADVTKNDRDPANGSYVVRFKKNIEADPELASKSAKDLDKAGVKGITLLERLLLELAYFMATDSHLDVENITLCSGSRGSVGGVPRVRWGTGGRGVSVDWCSPSDSDDSLRARAVVS